MNDPITHDEQKKTLQQLTQISEKNELGPEDIKYLQNTIIAFDQNNWKEFVNKKLTLLNDMKVYRLVTAIDIKRTTTEKIYNKVKELGNKSFVLEIEVDSSIVAGFTLEMNGKFYDQRISEKLYQFITK